MNLQDKIDEITSELDLIWDKYENEPRFKHPILPNTAPEKQNWGIKYHIGNSYQWRFMYFVGDTRDSCAFALRYYPDDKLYKVNYGKTHNSISENTSDLSHVIILFESCIVNHVIGSRPEK